MVGHKAFVSLLYNSDCEYAVLAYPETGVVLVIEHFQTFKILLSLAQSTCTQYQTKVLGHFESLELVNNSVI